jgi:para-nitrobenzyl esterase
MVWLHGGGLLDGEADDYDPSKLVLLGHAVVVTLNYRLGLLGWFAHPAIDSESHAAGNYGLMDQQLALKWVQRNIRAFGGDPDNVTLFGESAGGASVIAQMASPSARGLFHRAISQSGGYIVPAWPKAGKVSPMSPGGLMPLGLAEQTAQNFAVAAGCSDQSARCLRALPVEQILRHQAAHLSGLILDGAVIPQSLSAAFQGGKFNHVPFINGSNRDELRWQVALIESATRKPLAAADYAATLTALFGPQLADKILRRYPLSDYPGASLALGAVETDSAMACTGRKLSQWLAVQIPTYAYEFADRTAAVYYAAASFPQGAAHTLELPYLFPLFRGATGEAHALSVPQEQLSDRMVHDWMDIGVAGDVAKGSGRVEWPRYDASKDNYHRFVTFDTPPESQTFAAEHKCDFWDGVIDY